MSPLTLSAVVSAAIVVAICFYLVWHERYEDGLFGRIALAGLGLNCLIFALDAVFGSSQYTLLPSSALAVDFLALFMLRHAWRFTRWVRSGSGDWREEASPKRVPIQRNKNGA